MYRSSSSKIKMQFLSSCIPKEKVKVCVVGLNKLKIMAFPVQGENACYVLAAKVFC
jgi:hypothetical protein